MIVGVLKEPRGTEQRVALTPGVIPALKQIGLSLMVEAGCGQEAGYTDQAYQAKGAEVISARAEVFSKADIIVQVRAFGTNSDFQNDLPSFKQNQVVIGMMDPLGTAEAVREASSRGVTALALELLPRITRAQQMDILSSMATVAGYKAVLIAAEKLPKFFPLLMTAAGTVSPAHVLIMGAGVAGLQAIATAKRLGAAVEAYDVRPAVKEQVQSLGAKFVELDLDTKDAEDTGGYAKALSEEQQVRQRELLAKVIASSDVVITTALIPGQKAPILVTEDMVKGMAVGSMIVDLAAEQGGNCELTKMNETVVQHGVTILGPVNLPSTVAFHASQMYSKNVVNFLKLFVNKEGQLNIDRNDEIIQGTLVTQGGEVVHPKIRERLGLSPLTS